MFSLAEAEVYDVESFPNLFSIHVEKLFSDVSSTWELSVFRDDRQQLIQHFNWCQQNQIPMIGFKSLTYDYPMIHFIYMNPGVTVQQIYEKSQAILKTEFGSFGHTIWPRDRFAPQIDLLKIHHMNNKAKMTSLKALEINMRADTVVETPVPFGTVLTREQIETGIIPYNKHDVKETKRFAHISMKSINFRVGLIDQFGIDVLNYNDGKIGAELLKQKLGEDVCYDRSSGRRVMRQTPRYKIPLADIIFPYIQFQNPEFQRVLDFMRTQVLTPDDLDDPEATVKTKGVFKDLKAHVGGIDFEFGTGGMHGSVRSQRFVASDEWLIRDIDVKSLYPSIAIVNKLAPEHLGSAFTEIYPSIGEERAKHKKGTVENAAFKLANNVPWGQSNNKYSVFFDPRYAMTVPINGQLMICMLAEWLFTVPTFQMIAINTDGITYRIHRDHEPQAVAICKQWEAFTMLELEDANYKRMWVRDVNSYVAEDTDGKLKIKGAYWYPDPFNYENSISEASPPAWHKDLGGIVIQRAAVAAMVRGIDPETFIRLHSDPFDFMLRVKVNRDCALTLGGQRIQSTTRYYVANQGAAMVKISPAKGPLGAFKRKNGMTDREYETIAATVPAGVHDPRIHTGNRSTYQDGATAIQAGWKLAECNDARSFRFDNVNMDWYIAEARKLIIA